MITCGKCEEAKSMAGWKFCNVVRKFVKPTDYCSWDNGASDTWHKVRPRIIETHRENYACYFSYYHAECPCGATLTGQFSSMADIANVLPDRCNACGSPISKRELITLDGGE